MSLTERLLQALRCEGSVSEGRRCVPGGEVPPPGERSLGPVWGWGGGGSPVASRGDGQGRGCPSAACLRPQGKVGCYAPAGGLWRMVGAAQGVSVNVVSSAAGFDVN